MPSIWDFCSGDLWNLWGVYSMGHWLWTVCKSYLYFDIWWWLILGTGPIISILLNESPHAPSPFMHFFTLQMALRLMGLFGAIGPFRWSDTAENFSLHFEVAAFHMLPSTALFWKMLRLRKLSLHLALSTSYHFEYPGEKSQGCFSTCHVRTHIYCSLQLMFWTFNRPGFYSPASPPSRETNKQDIGQHLRGDCNSRGQQCFRCEKLLEFCCRWTMGKNSPCRLRRGWYHVCIVIENWAGWH